MKLIEIIKVIFYGAVEGVTEWLPISSTGHLILLENIIKMNVSDEFLKMFRVVIQLGAILAVIFCYFKRLWPFGYKKNHGVIVKKDIFSMWFKVIVSCIPAAVIGIIGDDYFEELFYNYISVAIALIVFGVAFIIIENINKNKNPKVNSIAEITYNTALIIGFFQVLAAVFPGTSRSGATILGALIIGVSRTVAAEYTFFLAVPVMFGASLLKLVKFGFNFTNVEISVLLIGMISAFLVSILVIKFLMSYIRKHDFKIFGWYRIVLGIIVLAVAFVR